MPQLRKALYFWPVALTVFLADCATKSLAERTLDPHAPFRLLGDFLRLSLVYNPSAAMSLDLGPSSRVLLSAVAAGALAGLWLWYRRQTTPSIATVCALGLLWAGAAGNLWDRLRSDRGVVDFIEVGIGGLRFWVFNVADVAVCIGALLLLTVSLRPSSGKS